VPVGAMAETVRANAPIREMETTIYLLSIPGRIAGQRPAR